MVAVKVDRRVIVAGAIYMLALFFMMIVRQYYTLEMPRSADTSSGRILAVEVNHGITVYLTLGERTVLYGSYFFLALAFVIAICTYHLTRSKKD
jgi:hypothetical protein